MDEAAIDVLLACVVTAGAAVRSCPVCERFTVAIWCMWGGKLYAAAAPAAAAYINGAWIAGFGRYGMVAPLGGDWKNKSEVYL